MVVKQRFKNGVRAMAKLIRQKVTTPLAEEIRFRELQAGARAVVDERDKEIVLAYFPIAF